MSDVQHSKGLISKAVEQMSSSSDDRVAMMVGQAVARLRPAMADLFMAARSAIELADETGDIGGGMTIDTKGEIVLSAYFGNLMQFSTIQSMVGEVRATSLLFFIDAIFRQITDAPEVKGSRKGGKLREGGKVVEGLKLTRVFRTAMNYFRHECEWTKFDGSSDENRFLRAIGVEENDKAPAIKFLKAIGVGTYMEFEDEIADALAELLAGRVVNVPRQCRNGSILGQVLAAAKPGVA